MNQDGFRQVNEALRNSEAIDTFRVFPNPGEHDVAELTVDVTADSPLTVIDVLGAAGLMADSSNDCIPGKPALFTMSSRQLAHRGGVIHFVDTSTQAGRLSATGN